MGKYPDAFCLLTHVLRMIAVVVEPPGRQTARLPILTLHFGQCCHHWCNDTPGWIKNAGIYDRAVLKHMGSDAVELVGVVTIEDDVRLGTHRELLV